MRHVWIGLALLLLVGAGSSAFAHQEGVAGESRHGGMGMMGPGMMGGMMGSQPSQAERPLISLALRHKEQLGLSPDQVKALESFRAEFQKEATRRSAEIQVAEQELAELLREEPVDLAKVEAKIRQIATVQAELRLARIRTLEKGKAVLTLEQRKKLEDLASQASSRAPGASSEKGSPMMGGRGMEEMYRFMQSGGMMESMTSMMEMMRMMGPSGGGSMGGMPMMSR